MVIIKILRDSVKRNPDAGITSTPVFQNKEYTFKFKTSEGRLPKELLSKCDIVEWNGADDAEDGNYQRGYIFNPNDFLLFITVPGITVEGKRDIDYVYHTPLPKWLFEYDEDTPMRCGGCSEINHFKDLEMNYPENSCYPEYYCPCGIMVNEEIQYESLDVVLRELGLV